MKLSTDEVLGFIKENDVKFVKLAFCDIKGEQKNISIMADKLEDALRSGVYFDSSNISGFESELSSELMLKPDLDTISILPWRPQQGRVVRFYCNIFNSDGSPYDYDTRAFLEKAQHKCKCMGFDCLISTEAEFYIFKVNKNGRPTLQPYDEGRYADMPPLDKCENIRREVCLSLQEMDMEPEKSHHESGPGQQEIDFRQSAPLKAADNFLAFKSLVKAVCGRNGVYASFLPKPLKTRSGSGLHINLSLYDQKGNNIFERIKTNELEGTARCFVAGIINHITEITAFLNLLDNSYLRLGKFEAPRAADWAYGNRSVCVRIPQTQAEKSRIEIRSADCALNPYLALALIIHAGLDGIEKNLTLKDEKTSEAHKLPAGLKEAVRICRKSEFIDLVLGEKIKEKYLDAIIALNKSKSFSELFKII